MSFQCDHDGDMFYGAPMPLTKAEIKRQKQLKLQVWYNLSLKEKNLFRRLRRATARLNTTRKGVK